MMNSKFKIQNNSKFRSPNHASRNSCTEFRVPFLKKEDVKNEGRSDYVYENKWKSTKCTPINTALYRKRPIFSDNRQNSVGLLSQTNTDWVINPSEGGARTGSSTHPIKRPIATGIRFRWPDDSMVRWSDHHGSPLCIRKQNLLALVKVNAAKMYPIDIK